MSDGYLRFRQWFGNDSGSLTVSALTASPQTLLTCKTNYTIYVQRIHVHLTGALSGATWTIEDTANTPVPGSGALPTDVAPADFNLDFGPIGYSLTPGTNLQLVMSTGGAAGIITWDAYMKIVPGTPTQTTPPGNSNPT